MTEGTDLEKAFSEAEDKLIELHQFCTDKGINLVGVVSRRGLDGESKVAGTGPKSDLETMVASLVNAVYS